MWIWEDNVFCLVRKSCFALSTVWYVNRNEIKTKQNSWHQWSKWHFQNMIMNSFWLIFSQEKRARIITFYFPLSPVFKSIRIWTNFTSFEPCYPVALSWTYCLSFKCTYFCLNLCNKVPKAALKKILIAFLMSRGISTILIN